MLFRLAQWATMLSLTQSRWSPGHLIDDAPLVVLYYENWAGWIRAFSPSHLERNFLAPDFPVRNFVLNYAFFAWNLNECSLVPVDEIDLMKNDRGGWTDSDWNIESTEEWETKKPAGGHLIAFHLIKALYPFVKLMPSIGGWSRSHTFHHCITNRQDVMLKSLLDHVIVWEWDGVDFDWEYPNCDRKPCGCQNEAVCRADTGFSNQAGAHDWANYREFVHKVRLAFNDLEMQLQRRLYITAALGVHPKTIDGNNDVWSEATPFKWICEEDDMDWVNLMTYDYHGPWTATTGPLAPLYSRPTKQVDVNAPDFVMPEQMSIDDSITRILKVCKAPHKLTMGLATYGKTWQKVPKQGSVTGLYQNSTEVDPRSGGTWEVGTVSYFDVKKNILPHCERTWDVISQTPTMFCDKLPLAPDLPFDSNGAGSITRGQPNTFISYEDPQSWHAKMAYARSKGMAGAIIWAASDTGNGLRYAPECAEELMEGLISGWGSTSARPPRDVRYGLAGSPGNVTRWPEYPCPHTIGYVRPMQTVDTKRCQPFSYSPLKKYMVLPKVQNPSKLGQDKMLIVPPVLADTTTTSKPAPMPSTLPPAMTSTVATPVNTGLQTSLTVPATNVVITTAVPTGTPTSPSPSGPATATSMPVIMPPSSTGPGAPQSGPASAEQPSLFVPRMFGRQ